MKRKKFPPAFPAPARSSKLLVRVEPSRIAMFRFLLEGYDNLALFSVLDRRRGVLELFFSPHQADAVRKALAAIAEELPMEVLPWPAAADAPGEPE